MSDNINFSGSVERFLKGDADPINIFGLNPTRAEQRANAADRSRRATQIEFEQNSEGLRKAGGTTDAATKQVKKLRNKTSFTSLSPFNPVPLPSVTISGILAESSADESSRKKRSAARRTANRRHADTALTVDNLAERPAGEVKRLSEARFPRRSILGRRT